ncbi:MAG: hypothetical protein QOH62_1385 [Solirubrobacteraceae bacterium]|jgi:glutamate/tyrosine decarboxylase-like PLP-dependent enzyme|nr:hypothetical protein [Solirubrobacteraceae bacterium]
MDPLLEFAARRGAEFVASLPERHVGWKAEAPELREALGGPLPEGPTDPQDVLRTLADGADPGIVASGSPRYFGFVIGGALPVALAADLLATHWDQNAGGYACGPATSVIEEVAGGWARDLLGLPDHASFGFTPGCNQAHVTALLAARHRLLTDRGWDVEADGLSGAPRLRVVVPADRHITIDRSLRLIGIGTANIVPVCCDDQARIDVGELERVLAADPGAPTIVCAQAGNVNTGAFDDIGAVADAGHAVGAWVHVDGAFGLWAAASPRRRHLVAGHERADSWATDGHKWLNVPYDCGIAFCGDTEAHRGAIAVTADYLQKDHGERDNGDWSPDFSRRARANSVWAVFKSLGRSGLADLVDDNCDRAVQFAELLSADPRAEVLNDVVLNQVLVRFGDDDAATDAVVAGIQREGTCWASGTLWRGRRALRISVSNWATSPRDVERSVAAMLAQVPA